MSFARRTAAVVLTLSLAVAVTSCGRDTSQPAAMTVQSLGISTHDNQTPSVAAEGQTVIVTWTAVPEAGGADVFAATSDDGGRTFGQPIRVNDRVGTVRTSGEQAPRVALSARTAAVVWTARENDRPEIRLAVSRDAGQTFGASQTIHAPALTGARGWASVAIDADDRIHVAWLDGRNAAVPSTSTHAGHGPATMSHSSSPRQDVYRAVISATEVQSESAVAANVCFCCKTAITIRPDGSGVVAWRHVFPTNMRDMALTTFDSAAAQQRPLVRISEDGWQIEGCPEDGPALAVDRAGRINAIWPTMVQGTTPTKGVFHAASADGLAFSPRERLDSTPGAVASHAQIAASSSGDVAAVWEELVNGARRIVLRRQRANNQTWSAPEILNAGESGSYPAAAMTSDALVVVWSSRTEPHATIAIARMP